MSKFLQIKTPEWFAVAQSQADSAVLRIDGIISGSYYDDNATEAKRFIAELNSITASRIELHINSPGGDVFAGFTIYNALVAWAGAAPGRQLDVIIDGLAASIASVIAMAGDTIAMPAASVLMIHNPWSYTVGDAAEHRKSAEMLETLGGQIRDIYADRTGMSAAAIAEMMTAETYMSAADALERGFATEVLDNKMAAAACDTAAEIFGSAIPAEILKLARALQKRKTERRQRDAGASRSQARAFASTQREAGEKAIAAEMQLLINAMKGL